MGQYTWEDPESIGGLREWQQLLEQHGVLGIGFRVQDLGFRV